MDRTYRHSGRETLLRIRLEGLQLARTLVFVAACFAVTGDCIAESENGCAFDSIDPQGAEVDGAWNGLSTDFGSGHALLDIYNPASPTADTFHAVLNRPAPALARLCNGHMSNTLTLEASLLPNDPPVKVYLDSLGCMDLIASKVTVAVTRCPICANAELPKYPSRIVCADSASSPPPARTILALYGLRETSDLKDISSQPWIGAATRFSLPLDEVNHPILVSARKVRMELCLDTEVLTTIQVHEKRLGPPTISEGFSNGCRVVEGRQLWLRPHRQSIAHLNVTTIPNRYGPPIALPFPSDVPHVDLNTGRYVRGRYRILEILPD